MDKQDGLRNGGLMAVGLTLALLAQAVSTDPAAAPKAAAPKPPVARQDGCANPEPKADTQQIVICAPKTEGYRLNPDIMEAKREVHGPGRKSMQGQGGMRPDEPCASGVGPMPCLTAGISLIGAALTAAEMAKRLSEGKEIGSMFVTDPHPDEYHLYLAAKARREQREAEAVAAKRAKARTEAAKAKAEAAGKVDTAKPDDASAK
jgi:hypothetical protein